jgi:hypothetical protein
MLKLYVVGTPTPGCIKVFVGQDRRTAEEAVLTDDAKEGTKAVIVCDKSQADKIIKIVVDPAKQPPKKEDVGQYFLNKARPIAIKLCKWAMYVCVAIAVICLLGNVAAFLNGNSTNPGFGQHFMLMLLFATLALVSRWFGKILRKGEAKT